MNEPITKLSSDFFVSESKKAKKVKAAKEEAQKAGSLMEKSLRTPINVIEVDGFILPVNSR